MYMHACIMNVNDCGGWQLCPNPLYITLQHPVLHFSGCCGLLQARLVRNNEGRKEGRKGRETNEGETSNTDGLACCRVWVLEQRTPKLPTMQQHLQQKVHNVNLGGKQNGKANSKTNRGKELHLGPHRYVTTNKQQAMSDYERKKRQNSIRLFIYF